MKKTWVAVFLSGVFLGSGPILAEGPDRSVRLRVVNSAGVSAAELLRAEKEAGYILVKAGIAVVWQDCSGPAGNDGECAKPAGPTEFWLHIATWKPTVASGESLGFTAMDRDPGDEGMAGVYYPMVKSMATGLGVENSAVLGPAMAHEIGHLLGVGHSLAGVMSEHFGRKQVVQASAGGLLFTAAEATQIRAEIARRMRFPP